MKCPNCSGTVPENAFFCPSCGSRTDLYDTGNTHMVFSALGQEPAMDRCPWCFAKAPGAGPVCPSCGKDLMASNQPYQLPVGSIIKNGDTLYLVGRAIGQGGFGITYAGWDQSLSIRVAIKEYFPSYCAERTGTVSQKVAVSMGQRTEYERGLNDFIREARILAKYRNVPGIVHVLARFEANNTSYIITEYLDGISLDRFIRNSGTLSFHDAVTLMCPILEALERIHAEVIHRDVSPQNIIVLPDGQARLLDFGAARKYLRGSSDQTSLLYGDGEHFSVVLKHGYAPYEQYSENGRQGPWTDVYGAGATLYFMLTGTSPEDGRERKNLDHLIRPSSMNKGLTARQDQVIMKALAVEPEDRYSSASDFMEALREADKEEKKTGKPLWIGAGLLALLVLVFAVFGRSLFGGAAKADPAEEAEPVLAEEEVPEESGSEPETEQMSSAAEGPEMLSEEAESEPETDMTHDEEDEEDQAAALEEPESTGPSDDQEQMVLSHSPFYGIWCGASKNKDDMVAQARRISEIGYYGAVFTTTDWDNLNSEKWYVVSAGVYSDKESAENALQIVRQYYPKAYVKYTGQWKGE